MVGLHLLSHLYRSGLSADPLKGPALYWRHLLLSGLTNRRFGPKGEQTQPKRVQRRAGHRKEGAVGVRFGGVREATLLELYRRLAGDHLSVEDREALEAALNFVLNDQRQAVSVAFLRRNVIRNARFTRWRSADSARRAAAARPLPDAVHRRLAWRTTDGDEYVDLINNETPESIALVSETIREVRTFAEALGAHGATCLRCLLTGLTVAETAAMAGVSIPTVERTWRKLRVKARSILAIVA